MRILAKILLCFATGLLFSHQLIVHHHDLEISSNHHDDNNDSDHHSDHFPPHHIAHIFSFENIEANTVKAHAQEIYVSPDTKFILPKSVKFKTKREYIEVRPPLILYFKYFPLRAPPHIS